MRPAWWQFLGLGALVVISVLWLPAVATWVLGVFCGAAAVGALYERQMRRFAPEPEPDNPLIAEVFE